MNLSFKVMFTDIIANIISVLLPNKVILNKRYFRLWERKGYHITPNYFTESIPDLRTLEDSLWTKQSELVGIDINDQRQIELLSHFSSRFKDEYNSFPQGKTSIPYEYFVDNGQFESVDGEILYCMIRYFKPARIFEIGSGNSTYLSAQALLKNEEEDGKRAELIVFDPYPNVPIINGFPGLSKLINSKIENIDLKKITGLKKNDILFIDSSHVLRIGGDVQYEYLEILPRLHKGVIVHIHDIFLPAEYPREWVLKKYRFYTEQYLLHAFLAFNDAFEVLWAGSYMHLRHPDRLEDAFSSYNRLERWPGSFWIRKMR